MAGKIYPSSALFLREIAGDATGDKGSKYELSYLLNGIPHITSQKTGKQWILPWEELIALAIEAGIDQKGDAEAGNA